MKEGKIFENTIPKNMRRRIHLNPYPKLGDWEGGKMHYPSSLKSKIYPYMKYLRKGFSFTTQYNSILTGEKKSIEVDIWLFVNKDTLLETIGIQIHHAPVFIPKQNLSEFIEFPGWITMDWQPVKPKMPRHMISPHRKTLDRYGLNIALFQHENYIGIPICMATKNKTDVSEGWLYLYNTVINGKEGIKIDTLSQTPISLCVREHTLYYY